MKRKKFYIIGSLRNNYIRELENQINKNVPEIDTFAEWHGAGKSADDSFKEYHKGRGLTFRQALQTAAARHIFLFDKHHLDSSDGAILVMPAGKSCCMEAGYMVGKDKPVYVLYPDGEPDTRWDLMFQFCNKMCFTEQELFETLKNELN